MVELVKFSADACTEERVKKAHSNYPGKIGFKCGEDPTGEESCYVVGSETSGDIYPGTLLGCQQCTSECGSDVEPEVIPDDEEKNGDKADDKKNGVKLGMIMSRRNMLFLVLGIVLVLMIIMLYFRIRRRRQL